MIAWRRNRVIELKAQGLEQIEIARTLQVSSATVTSDLKYLRNEAKESIREYTTEDLPLQFRTYKVALQNAIREYWRLSKEAKDDHDKIDALKHYMDSHLQYWALMLGGEAYENDRQYKNKLVCQQQQQQLELQHRLQEQQMTLIGHTLDGHTPVYTHTETET